MLWHIITGEYPPDPGGVSDYSAVLAQSLAASGHEVRVWCAGDDDGVVVELGGIAVHRVAGRFGPIGLARLGRALDRYSGSRRILIQYVPSAFGWKAMNLLFVAWVLTRRFWRQDDIRVMFHEVAFPWVRTPLRHNILAVVNRIMAAALVRSCTQVYISIPGWLPSLRQLGARRVPIAWTPIPATVPTGPSADDVSKVRARLNSGNSAVSVVGHFGTYGTSITSILAPALSAILNRRPNTRAVLVGAGGERWRDELITVWPHLSSRIVALGTLPAPAVAEYIMACDLMIQPYPDGASSRRTTLMAPISNGVPVLTTLGPLSEPVWSEGSVAVTPPGQMAEAAIWLLDHPAELRELGKAGRRLYDERFTIGRTIAILLLETPNLTVDSPGCLS